VRFRAYPTPWQAETLAQWIGCQRFIYNAKVEEDLLFSALWRANRFTHQYHLSSPLDQQYSHFKDPELTPWLSKVPSQVLRNGAYRFHCAKQRQLKGLARAPSKRRAHEFNSVMLTRELFRFEARPCDDKDGAPAYALFIGTPRFPVGELAFVAHRPFGIPNSITIRRDSAGRWFVSFCYEHASDAILRTPAELAYELAGLPEEVLKRRVLGLDRNVSNNCVATSDGASYRVSEV